MIFVPEIKIIIIKKITIMALQITENKGTFHLQGCLNSTTTRSFVTHFEHLINTIKTVKVNIGKIKEIDQNGVIGFKTLIKIAQRNNKSFFIVGHGSKDIYEDYSYSNVA
jgi:ABC-type transporter Mla MlaB component